MMGYGSAPCNPSDIMLYNSSAGYSIYATSLSVVGDSIHVTWNIPAVAPSGVYDLHLDEYTYDPFNGNCLLGPISCILPQRMGIEVSVVSGIVYFDANADSLFNAGDILLSNRKVLLLPDSIITFTDNTGAYTFFADTGAHSIVFPDDPYFTPFSSDTINLQVGQTNSLNNNFALTQSAQNFRTDIYVSGRPRCNTLQNYTFYYYNHSLTPVDLLFKIYHSGIVNFSSAVPPPDSIVGDTIYFSIQNATLATGYLQVSFMIPGIGNTITFNAIVQSFDQLGNLLYTNANKIDQVVSCSYDPNDKSVNPAGEQANHYTLNSDVLFYNIRFQNTGTDTAYDVHIVDTIDANLDFSTFELISSSHPVVVSAGFNGIVDFLFYNIMLPDSNVNNPGSNGFVSYTIRAKAGLPEQTVVRNTAYIYFDQNLPVVTNQTENSMVSIIPVNIQVLHASDAFTVFPNPFSGEVTFQSKLPADQVFRILLSDIQGRELIRVPLTPGGVTLNLGSMSPGIYIYKVFNELNGSSYFGRLIKQ
jgi:uncharacterized repeat protein (TIGR01451 family)